MSRTLIVDGDSLIYAAGAGCEVPVQWSAWEWTLHADLDQAIAKLRSELDILTERLEGDEVVFCLTDKTNWRKKVLPTYKHNRVSTRKPMVHEDLRKWVQENYETFLWEGLEGDDVVGILMTAPYSDVPEERVAVSIDKDMNTIPGLHFDYGKHKDEPNFMANVRHVSDEAAALFHLTQTLTGDATDGYKGCPSVGPVRAAKLLEGLDPLSPDAWAAVVAAYEKAGQGEKEALTTARVARILHHGEYDQKTGKVKLWRPPR